MNSNGDEQTFAARRDQQRIDVNANRTARKWSRSELLARLLWGLATPFFALSPRLAWAWRRWLLRLFGARIGDHVHIYPSVRITIPWNLSIGHYTAVGDRAILYALGPIRIGERVTISQGAHLCAGTHDWRDASMPLLKPPIEIGDDAWVCADSFIGPGINVGNHAIVGARAVAMKNVPPDAIVAGNPARHIKVRNL